MYKEEQRDIKLVISSAMQKFVIQKFHEDGHFSASKTEAMLRHDFWMPGVNWLVEKIERNCISCILAKRKGGKQEGWLHPLKNGTTPFDTYHIDPLDPLASRHRSHRQVEEAIHNFGNPRRSISDRRTAFMSEDFATYCKAERIEHHLKTTGVPRANGQVERINRTVIPMLTKLTAPKAIKWFKHVECVQQFLNSILHRSLGTSPFRVMFGVNPRRKKLDEIIKKMQEELVKLFCEKRDKIQAYAAKQIANIQLENPRNYNKKRIMKL